jgi:hypothetical protein
VELPTDLLPPPQWIADFATSVAGHVADADAAFQLDQQRGWNAMLQGTPLLEGYDRLGNLGFSEVRVTVDLAAAGPGFWRSAWRRITFRRPAAPSLRVAVGGEPVAMRVTAVVSRDAQGRWKTALSSAS